MSVVSKVSPGLPRVDVPIARPPRPWECGPAAVCRWSLLLLSPLLSAQPRSSGGKLTRTAGPPGPRTGSGAAELRITRVFPCVARGFKARASFHVRRLLLVAVAGC